MIVVNRKVTFSVADPPDPIWPNAQASIASTDARMPAPTRSNRRCSRRSAGAKVARRPTAATAIGGLIQNIDCQPNLSVSKPPSAGPAAVVNAEAPAQMATAELRSSRGYMAPISARLAGATSAAATPCAIRQATNAAAEGTIAHPTDANAKRTQP